MARMTAADYIIETAKRGAIDGGYEFSDDFFQMVQLATMKPELVNPGSVMELEATRPAYEDESIAAGTMFTAYRAARDTGDPETVDRVVQVGLVMVSKWAEYLAATERHPRLTFI